MYAPKTQNDHVQFSNLFSKEYQNVKKHFI